MDTGSAAAPGWPPGPPLRAVLFDLDETLIADGAATDAALRAAAAPAAARYGIDPDALAGAVRRNAGALWRAAPTAGYCRAIGLASWEGLWAGFAGDDPPLRALRAWAPAYRRLAWSQALLELDVDDPDLAGAMAAAFPAARRARASVFPDAEPVLRALRARVPRLRLGLLTNGAPDLQREKLALSGLGPWFDAVVVSGEEGVGKPDAAIFRRALDRLGVPPEAAAMVGDRLDRDVLGARRAGIFAVWLNRGGTPSGSVLSGDHRAEADGDAAGGAAGEGAPDAVVATLDALPGVLRLSPL
jgi:putative hydrolase of the HAD superfamily